MVPSLPCAFLAALLISSNALAASITFNPATTCSGDADVRTDGTLLSAYTWDAGDTVNGVSFASTAVISGAVDSHLTLAGFSKSTAVSVLASLSTAYQHMLRKALNGTTNPATVTLTGLTIGKTYLVQIWCNDPKSAARGRGTVVVASGGASVTLSTESGEYTYGTFMADAETQDITLTAQVPLMSAIQLRDVTPVAPPTLPTLSLELSGSNPVLNIQGKANSSFAVERSTHLSSWTEIAPSVSTDSNGVGSYTDTSAPPGAAFYRVRPFM